MKQLVRFSTATALMICLAAAALAQTPQPQRFRIVEIVDHNGFERPIVAARIMIPAHWQPQGGIVWDSRAVCQGGQVFRWGAGNPQGFDAIEVIPAYAWQMNNLPPEFQSATQCHAGSMTNIQQYLQVLAQTRRPASVVLDYRPRPDLVEKLNAHMTSQSTPGSEFRVWAEAGEILIGYTQNGHRVREIIAASAVFTHSRMADSMGGIMEYFVGSALPAFSYRAQDVNLDFKLYDAIGKSLSFDSQWQARMAQHNSKMAQIRNQGARERSQIIARTGSEVGDIIQKGWKQRQEIIDKGQENWSRGMREVEAYNDPMRDYPVELPSVYDHAWRMPDGTYVMSDNPNFDPNVDWQTNATRLQRTQ